MIAPTHLTFGFVVGAACGAPVNMMIPLLAGSVFPDIDQKFKFFVKHRTITHSLLAIIIAVVINPWFGIGYITHVFLDSFTVMKVPLLYPAFPRKYFGLGILRTGKIGEFLLCLSLIGIVYLFCAGPLSGVWESPFLIWTGNIIRHITAGI